MTTKVVITCDQTGEEIKDGSYITLAVDDIVRAYPSNIAPSVIIPRVLDRDYHFKSIQALKDWLLENC